MTGRYTERGSPFAPHTPEETAAMLETIGVDDEAELFDVPDPVQFDGDLGIEARSERAVRREVADTLGENDDAVELLGRGHYGHYVPSIVDHLSDRSEFLTSYTQYQPEITQGFLQVLFEYQSMIAEITGLEVANCSMYDAATALGEAATLSSRVRETSGTTILVPELLREERRAVLDNYVAGGELTFETYPHEDGIADVDALEARIDEDVTMVYAETPTVRGTIEESVGAIADLAHEHDALCTLGSDPVALSLLEEPAAAGVDVVVGNAAVLGLPTANGMGMGLFATSEDYVRQVPGRLVGASEDAADRRTYTLTLQTREQHIRKERATSNICTNQAWVALRAAMHAATLGPAGLADLANESVERAAALAERVDDVTGVQAPVHDRHHCREFVAHTDEPARAVAADLADEGYLVHTVGDHELQVCVTGVADEQLDDFVATLAEVAT